VPELAVSAIPDVTSLTNTIPLRLRALDCDKNSIVGRDLRRASQEPHEKGTGGKLSGGRTTLNQQRACVIFPRSTPGVLAVEARLPFCVMREPRTGFYSKRNATMGSRREAR
jgi:hypothetical protein